VKVLITFGEDQPTEVADLAMDGVRTDVPPEGDLTAFIQPLVGVPLDFCFILHDIARNQPLLDAMAATEFDTSRTYIEPFNEREQGRVTPEVMIEGVNAVYRDCYARGFRGRIVASGDSNLDDPALRFYRKVCPKIPSDCVVAFHDYPRGTQPEHKPWHRTHERDLELFLDCLKGGQTPACSEFGFHMAEEDHRGTPVRLAEGDVYCILYEYLRRHARYDLLFTTIYQFRDGPGEEFLDRFGLHAEDGARKRQAYVVGDWKAEPVAACRHGEWKADPSV
jgi:hypothetical protein